MYLPDGDAGRGPLRLAVRVAHTGLQSVTTTTTTTAVVVEEYKRGNTRTKVAEKDVSLLFRHRALNHSLEVLA